jgi:16S rRNA (guanine527-N7)-methyltransferase
VTLSQPERAPLPDRGVLSRCFGDQTTKALAYADLLATSGVQRGLIGPREVGRLWDRHILNCAVVADLVAPGATVVDVGSGAGLPGLVLAIRRPDLKVWLVEPLLRRCVWLGEAVEAVELENVTVVRGRAEEQARTLSADVVTARAVATLDVLAGWCLPLAKPGGVLLAMKGRSAPQELTAAEPALRRLGATGWSVVECGMGLVDPVTTVVRVTAGRRSAGAPGSRSGRGRRHRTS